jgi:N-acylneuraminate cytidylyltransferase
MIYYVIPARKGSKGLPLKNRALVRILVPNIPQSARSTAIVTTDDEDIREWALAQGIRVIDRPSQLAGDHASLKPVMQHAVDQVGAAKDDVVVMLFPTYPQRTWSDVEAALSFFLERGAPSMCCRKQAATHPYLTYLALPDGKGKKVIEHQLYRRQDYPECFEVSHFICVFRVGALSMLDDRLLCESSVFYPIEDVIDVDAPSDLAAYVRRDHGRS